uniref:uncharacterized protein n=1 Tax=Semicossyphus pulcher TaxID=241346 RepID=UPI0037E73F45
MITLWLTLLLLHQAYTLAPVTQVQLGEPATITCGSPDILNNEAFWFKQSAGDALKLIVRRWKNTNKVFGAEFSDSRFDLKVNEKMSHLTILRTLQEDEGMYHCVVLEWYKITLCATYLSIIGNTQRTSNYTVVQRPTVSDPVRPGDLMTLQCSVLSDSESQTCPGGHSVYWFRAGSDKSHPHIIYTDGNRRGGCDERSDTQRSCVYRFSKNVSSSDAGTYYCAVATCGEILFGDGTKLELEQTTSSEFVALVIAIVCLVISVIGNIVFICHRSPRAACGQCKGIESASLPARRDNSNPRIDDITEGGHDLNYAALHCHGPKSTRGRKTKELKTEDGVYSQVKCSM